MNEYLTHLTSEGERWDLLALEYYGDPLFLEPLLRANPYLANKTLLAAGLYVKVPLIELSEAARDEQRLVSWR